MSQNIHPVARWTVDPARWRQFVALDEKLSGSGKLANRIASQTGPEPVEVIVGWSEVMVGGELHAIRPGTVRAVSLIQDAPRCLEIAIREAGADWCLRFPTPDKSFVEIARVRNHFISDQYQRPRPV